MILIYLNIFIIVNVYVGLGDYEFNINNINYNLYAIWLKQFKVVPSQKYIEYINLKYLNLIHNIFW